MDNYFDFYTKDNVNVRDVQSAFQKIMNVSHVGIPIVDEYEGDCPVLIAMGMEEYSTEFDITWPEQIEFDFDDWLSGLAKELNTDVVAGRVPENNKYPADSPAIQFEWIAATPQGDFYTPIIDDNDDFVFKPQQELQVV